MVSQDLFPITHQQSEVQSSKSLVPAVVDEEGESMDSASNDCEASTQMPESLQCSYPAIPAYFSPFFPLPMPFWGEYPVDAMERETHEIVRPTAVHSKSPINVDQLVGMSKLSLGEPIKDSSGPGHIAPSSLSLKLLGGSSRQSAFHANPSSDSANMNSGSPIHAV